MFRSSLNSFITAASVASACSDDWVVDYASVDAAASAKDDIGRPLIMISGLIE